MGFVHKARSLWARLGWEGTGKTLKWSSAVLVHVSRITDSGRTQTSQVNIKPGGGESQAGLPDRKLSSLETCRISVPTDPIAPKSLKKVA